MRQTEAAVEGGARQMMVAEEGGARQTAAMGGARQIRFYVYKIPLLVMRNKFIH